MLAPDTLETAEGPLTIQPVDHASLALLLADQVIYIDPTGPRDRWTALPLPTLILFTHAHGDHFSAELLDTLIGNEPAIVSAQVAIDGMTEAQQRLAQPMRNGERLEVDRIGIEAIPAHNTTAERLKYHPVGVGNGYVLTLGGRRIYVAGDTEPTPEMRALRDIDVAFLPMNLPYTMVAEQAAEAVKAFRPKAVYPFHYTQGPEPGKFAELMRGEAGIEVRLRDWYVLSKDK